MSGKFTFKQSIPGCYKIIKQKNAIMPNLVHSLDATSIYILYKLLNEYKKHNIYTIHDCFSVTANDVELLIEVLKSVYVTLYSLNQYLECFHSHVKYTIKNTFGSDTFSDDEKYIYLPKSKTSGNESVRQRMLYPKFDFYDNSIYIAP